MIPRIALVIPYFGELPRWFPFFAHSVRWSPIFDVHLLTDATVEFDLPSNITVHPFSLSAFNDLATSALSFPVSVTRAFKLCDFRPAFGKIFHQYIRDYEFWAFGDIDLVCGDLAAFLRPLLDEQDVISFRKGWVSGSLCVLRNCEVVNNLYRNSADCQKVFQSHDHHWFDELGGFFYSDVLQGKDVLDVRGGIDSFTHVLKRSGKEGLIRCFFGDLACENLAWGETVIFDKGALNRISDGNEVMYIHYVCMKRRFFDVPRVAPVPDRFYIRNTGIYLEKPGLRSTTFQESGRILRGGMDGARRLIGRYLG